MHVRACACMGLVPKKALSSAVGSASSLSDASDGEKSSSLSKPPCHPRLRTVSDGYRLVPTFALISRDSSTFPPRLFAGVCEHGSSLDGVGACSGSVGCFVPALLELVAQAAEVACHAVVRTAVVVVAAPRPTPEGVAVLLPTPQLVIACLRNPNESSHVCSKLVDCRQGAVWQLEETFSRFSCVFSWFSKACRCQHLDHPH